MIENYWHINFPILKEDIMIDYIGISIIIITITGCVSFVSHKAYQRGLDAGKEIGIGEGRLQVLEEDLIREQYKKVDDDHTVVELKKYLEKVKKEAQNAK